MSPARGRADLVRLLGAMPPGSVARAAELLGYDAPVLEAPASVVSASAVAPVARREAEGVPAPPVPFWRLESVEWDDTPRDTPAPRVAQAGLTEADRTSPGHDFALVPATPPLTPWARLWPAVRGLLMTDQPSREPDVEALVRALGRGAWVRRIPRRARRAWTPRVTVWIDRSRRLAPFWADQDWLVEQLVRVCGREAVCVYELSARGQDRALRGRGHFAQPVEAGEVVLLLGDVGAYARGVARAWARTAARLRRGGARIGALVPAPVERFSSAAAAWGAQPWAPRRSPAEPDAVRRLLRLASPCLLVQLGLLRRLRQILPARVTDAATEVDALAHDAVKAADSTGMVLHPDQAKVLQEELVSLVPEEIQAAVSAAIAAWHADIPREVLLVETVLWDALLGPSMVPGDLEAARELVWRTEASTVPGEGGEASLEDLRFGRLATACLPAAAYRGGRLGAALERIAVASRRGVPGATLPEGVSAMALAEVEGKAPEITRWGLGQRGGRLRWAPSDGRWGVASSPVAAVTAGATTALWDGERLALGEDVPLEGARAVRLDVGGAILRVAQWWRPDWAVAAGRDRFGLWADVALSGVRQRMRWIPPGRFLMGSPRGEAGRDDDEGPRHEVTLTAGFWLGDTPVTQALWGAVMGENPSRFPSPDRPVEQVSWDDCRRFFAAAAGELPGARFPSEAEWEYACRAGTETASWRGPVEILGINNAPALNDIAWYGGNSGRDYDLEEGMKMSWDEKQYDDPKGGTRRVKGKDPNPYGLYDMLGNVWEWCGDFNRTYGAEPVRDPYGTAGSYRVYRGGSWNSSARSCRAAYRSWDSPGDRYWLLGFRLARGQGRTPEAEPWEPDRPAERGGHRRRRRR